LICTKPHLPYHIFVSGKPKANRQIIPFDTIKASHPTSFSTVEACLDFNTGNPHDASTSIVTYQPCSIYPPNPHDP